jgi:hypothetical protein
LEKLNYKKPYTWQYDYTLCVDCATVKDKGQFCPICSGLYSEFDYDTPMVQCDVCNSWIHQRCDKEMSLAMYETLGMDESDSIKYACEICRKSPKCRTKLKGSRIFPLDSLTNDEISEHRQLQDAKRLKLEQEPLKENIPMTDQSDSPNVTNKTVSENTKKLILERLEASKSIPTFMAPISLPTLHINKPVIALSNGTLVKPEIVKSKETETETPENGENIALEKQPAFSSAVVSPNSALVYPLLSPPSRFPSISPRLGTFSMISPPKMLSEWPLKPTGINTLNYTHKPHEFKLQYGNYLNNGNYSQSSQAPIKNLLNLPPRVTGKEIQDKLLELCDFRSKLETLHYKLDSREPKELHELEKQELKCLICDKVNSAKLLIPVPDSSASYPPFLADEASFCTGFVHTNCLFQLNVAPSDDGYIRNAIKAVKSYLIDKKIHAICDKAYRGKLIIARDYNTAEYSFWNKPDESHLKVMECLSKQAVIRIGALNVLSLGVIKHFKAVNGGNNSNSFIAPEGYCAVRLFWSYQHPFQRTLVVCKVVNQKFQIIPLDDVGRLIEKNSVVECVNSYFERLNLVYKKFTCVRLGKIPLFRHQQNSLFCEYFFGFNLDVVRRQIEALPNAGHCRDYMFSFVNKEQVELRMQEYRFNLNGPPTCARVREYKSKKAYRGKNSTSHQISSNAVAVSDDVLDKRLFLTPMLMRYRQMKQNQKKLIKVGASVIQGYGLFSQVRFEAHDLVIEYVGEVVGQKVADYRERVYDGEGLGTYLFRIEDDSIVDATKAGNEARFINHSCAPNCYAKIVGIEGSKKVIIFANRVIEVGEELTYDYKFPLEDTKLPCHCGASNCQGRMN